MTGDPHTAVGARLGNRHGVDLLFVLALYAVALAGWATTYDGPGWLITAGVAGAFGVLVAVAVVDYGGGAEFVLAVLVPVYLVAAGPIAAGRVGLPDGDVMVGGITSTGTVWRTLLTTHPPVEALGEPLLPVLLLSLFMPALTVSLAVRSSRMLSPILPVTITLFVVLAMGQYEPFPVVGRGLLFCGLTVLWLRVRAGRLEEERTGRDPNRRVRILGSVALIAVVGLLVAVIAPGGATREAEVLLDGSPAEADRLLLRDQMAPFDAAALTTPLDRFRRYVAVVPRPDDTVHGDVLVRVDGAPRGTRLRFATMERYDGTRWTPGNEADPLRRDDRYLRVGTSVRNPAVVPQGEPTDVTVKLTGKWDIGWVPTYGAVQGFAFDSAVASAAGSLRYNPAAQSAVLNGSGIGGDSYSFTTVPTEAEIQRDDEAAEFTDEELFRAARFLDTQAFVWRQGSLTQMDALFRVAAQLKETGRYSDGSAGFEARFSAGHTQRRLGSGFVKAVPTAGNDEQYAAVFALLAARLRIPSRVVVGAVLDDAGVVRGKDVEAWVEVRVTDGSWRTVPTEMFMSEEPVIATPVAELEEREFPDLQRLREETDPADDPVERDRAEEEEAEREAEQPGPVERWWWVAVLVLVVGYLSLVPVLRWRRRRRRRTAARVADRFAGGWDEVVDHARALGVPVPPGPRPHQAAAVGGEGWADLAARADAGSFAVVDARPTDAEEFWSLIDDQLAELDAAASRRRRLRARWLPRRPGP